MEIRKGQKIPLNENFLTIKFERNAGNVEIDTAAFMQSVNVKVEDEDFVFYGNPRHNSGGVIYRADDSLEVDLSKVPARIEKISFTATIYEPEQRKHNFSKVSGMILKISATRTGAEVATFRLEQFHRETAIVLGEIYRYKGSWKFNAVGAGFNGGLAALCKNFGIEVIEDTSPPVESKIKTPAKVRSEEKISQNIGNIMSSSNPRNSQPSKIEIRKGQKINIVKSSNVLGEIVINLNWNKPSGLFSRGIDLDLACLYELKDGRVGAVQALGNLFGDLNFAPYIALDGDDRTGNVAAGETIRVNGKFANKIERILIFTFIYSGAANWNEAKGVVTVKCSGSPDLIVRMDDYGSSKRTCAIALLENIGGTFSVEKIVNFYYDSQEMDKDFDWGLQWTVGRKD